MANVIKLGVENPDEILNAGEYGALAIIRLQWSATETGTYADVAGTGATPTTTVTAGTRSYTAYDPAGTSSTWYRTRFENAGATRLSDWSDPFLVAPEGSGLICSLDDCKQRIGGSAVTNSSADEDILEHIRQVTADILTFTGRQLVPDPASGSKTYRFHTYGGRELWIPKGIRSITSLGVAVTDQPESGGTYTVAAASDYYIDPPLFERTAGWPGMRVCLSRSASVFFGYAAFGAEITGAFGWPSVPADVSGIAVNAVVRRWQGRGSGTYAIATEEFASRVLRWFSPEEQEQLARYRLMAAA